MKIVSKILDYDIHDVIIWNGSNSEEVNRFIGFNREFYHTANDITGEQYLHCKCEEGCMRVGKNEYVMKSVLDGYIHVMSPNIIFDFYKKYNYDSKTETRN